MILTFTPNPCVDKTVYIDTLEPGGRIRSRKCTCIPGGKGTNVARAVKALGHDGAAMVIVGGPAGQHVVDMIKEQDGLRCIPIWVEGMTRTITTVLEESIHRQTAFFEPGSPVTKPERENLLHVFREAVAQARVVTLNGTVPDPSLQTVYRDLITIAHESGVIPLLDSHGPEFKAGLEAKPHLVKPNLHEAEEAVGFPLDTEAAQWRAIDWFHDHGVKIVVMSLGPDGALVSDGDTRFHARPPKIEEINAVGSGDALLAAFAIGLHEGWPLDKMARLGVAAGAANAMSWDIGHFTKNEVETVAAEVRIESRFQCA